MKNLFKRHVMFAVCAFGAGLLVRAGAPDAPLNPASPTGTHGLIMIDKLGGEIRFMDPANDQLLTNFGIGAEAGLKPHELVITPDHRTAYVTVYGDGVYGNNPHPGHTIAVIDLVNHLLRDTIDVAPYQAPHGIQIDSEGKLYVACDLSRKVLIIDPQHKRIEAAIDVEGTGHWIALLDKARKLYVASKNDRLFLSVIDLKARRMIGRVPMPNGTQGLVASPDGQMVIAADMKVPMLHVISTVTDTEIEAITMQGAKGGLYKMFFSPDGLRMVAVTSSGQMNLFNAKDLQAAQQMLQSAGTGLMGVAFAADGRTALVGNHNEGTVTRIDLQNARVLNTFAAGRGIETLAYY